MTTENLKLIENRARNLALELSELDDFLHALAVDPGVLGRREAAAALRVHRQICDSVVIANRALIWAGFGTRMLAWDGNEVREIDTSGYSVSWATGVLQSIENLFVEHRRDLRTLRKVARRVLKQKPDGQTGFQAA